VLTGAALAVVSATLATNPTAASHPFPTLELLAPLHTSPEPNSATYSLCEDDPAILQVWAYGPEIWEQAELGDISYDLLQGCVSANVVLQWEFAAQCAIPTWIACEFGTMGTLHPGSQARRSGRDPV